MSGHENKSLPYETSDVSIKGVVGFGAVLAVATALVFLLMLGAFKLFERQVAADQLADAPATRIESDGPTHPPAPVLQGSPGSEFPLADPRFEMEAMTAEQDELLHGSGWINRTEGRVRLPIETAKRLMLERGFPTREEASGEEAP